MVGLFALAPIQGGDDWETFVGTANRIIYKEPIYGEIVTHAYYSNPPWLAIILLPVAMLPFRWGWAIISVLTIILPILVLKKWQGSVVIIQIFLVALSPPTLYILIHGQIDAIILSGVLLPVQFWWLVAFTKPQVAIGLLFGVPRNKLKQVIIITSMVILISFILFGNWVLDLLIQPAEYIQMTHNIWLGIWPLQVPVGVALLVLGISRKKESLLVGASPFLSPYAATSSFLGIWVAMISYLKTWQSIIVFLSWWGAIVYRIIYTGVV